MATLPDDILRLIFSFLSSSTLTQCRLLNHATSPLATALAFHHVRLEDLRDPLPFTRISETPHLRSLVRQVTIDSGSAVSVLSHEDRVHRTLRLTRFLVALPRLRLFEHCQTLHIRFVADNVRPPSADERAAAQSVRGRQYFNLQTRVLSVILDCVTGRWSSVRHRAWEKDWMAQYKAMVHVAAAAARAPGRPLPRSVVRPDIVRLPFSPADAMKGVVSLTIANLPDAIEHELYTSATFQSLVASAQLRELKILICCERGGQPAESIFIPTKYECFEQLPRTWLSPVLTSQLRVLSLYCDHYYGWTPKLDLRMLGPGPPLPNLRVLALGDYVFSHEWQVDWIASLGAENGRGGLEELYLDDCPIMWRARTLGPLDTSVQEMNGVQIDSTGYPVKEIMTANNPHQPDIITIHFPLRWSHVLATWRGKMHALKVFKMGSGDWDENHNAMVRMARTMDLEGDVESRQEVQKVWQRRVRDTIHLNYDKPSLAECLAHDNANALMGNGLGMNQKRENVLQYVHFEVGLGPTPWMERDFERDMMDSDDDGSKLYKAVRGADESAWTELKEAVAVRCRQ